MVDELVGVCDGLVVSVDGGRGGQVWVRLSAPLAVSALEGFVVAVSKMVGGRVVPAGGSRLCLLVLPSGGFVSVELRHGGELGFSVAEGLGCGADLARVLRCVVADCDPSCAVGDARVAGVLRRAA